MSQSVAGALEVICKEKTRETRVFIRNIDKFFDCLNGRSTQTAKHNRNENVAPYHSLDDERFEVNTNCNRMQKIHSYIVVADGGLSILSSRVGR